MGNKQAQLDLARATTDKIITAIDGYDECLKRRFMPACHSLHAKSDYNMKGKAITEFFENFENKLNEEMGLRFALDELFQTFKQKLPTSFGVPFPDLNTGLNSKPSDRYTNYSQAEYFFGETLPNYITKMMKGKLPNLESMMFASVDGKGCDGESSPSETSSNAPSLVSSFATLPPLPSVESKIGQLEAEIHRLKGQNTGFQNEILKLKRKNEALEASNKFGLQTLAEESKDLEARVHHLQRNLDNKTKWISALEQEKATLQWQKFGYKTKLRQLKDENKMLEDSTDAVDSLMQENINQKARIFALQYDHKEISSDYRELKVKNADLNERNDRLLEDLIKESSRCKRLIASIEGQGFCVTDSSDSEGSILVCNFDGMSDEEVQIRESWKVGDKVLVLDDDDQWDFGHIIATEILKAGCIMIERGNDLWNMRRNSNRVQSYDASKARQIEYRQF